MDPHTPVLLATVFTTTALPPPPLRETGMKTPSSRSNFRAFDSFSSLRMSASTVVVMILVVTLHHEMLRVNSFQTISTFKGGRLTIPRDATISLDPSRGWTMRDGSASYWFRTGDVVRVDTSVTKSNVDLRDRIGTVQETWEKCDVDPTCCCAEQVDCNMAVLVEFPGTVHDPTDTSASFTHHFAEDELVKVAANSAAATSASDGSSSADVDSLPFDGVGCATFKLEALQIESKTRKLASFEPEAPPSS